MTARKKAPKRSRQHQEKTRKLGWKYCECGCKGYAAQFAGIHFWAYDDLAQSKESVYLGVGHGHVLSKPIGTYPSLNRADAAAYKHAGAQVGPAEIKTAKEILTLSGSK